MPNFLQDVNRFKKMMKVQNDLNASAQNKWKPIWDDWANSDYPDIGMDPLEIYRQRIKLRDELYDLMVDKEFLHPVSDWDRFYQKCKEAPDKVVDCFDEAYRVMEDESEIPTGEELASDPQMYVDNPHKFIRDAANKLLTGED